MKIKPHEVYRLRGYDIVASKGYTYIHSKTGLLFVSSKTSKEKLFRYLSKKDKSKYKSYTKNYSYKDSSVKRAKVIYDNSGASYYLYKGKDNKTMQLHKSKY